MAEKTRTQAVGDANADHKQQGKTGWKDAWQG